LAVPKGVECQWPLADPPSHTPQSRGRTCPPFAMQCSNLRSVLFAPTTPVPWLHPLEGVLIVLLFGCCSPRSTGPFLICLCRFWTTASVFPRPQQRAGRSVLLVAYSSRFHRNFAQMCSSPFRLSRSLSRRAVPRPIFVRRSRVPLSSFFSARKRGVRIAFASSQRPTGT
jgi:hypothetical protein